MGYGYYKLASGKEAGYLVEAKCEHPGCNAEIDRGMAYACGGSPGDQGGCSCEGYFCYEHLFIVETNEDSQARTELGTCPALCAQCTAILAFLDQIDEAEHYRADPKHTPNEATLKILRHEECKYLPEATQ